MPSFWSVERDGDAIVATCPEALRYPSDDRPEWMAHCAAALRDELRLLEVEQGTLLEATLIGAPPRGADLENVLLDNVGVPAAQLHAGVQAPPAAADRLGSRAALSRAPARRGGRATPTTARRLAQVRVPITDGLELETRTPLWLAVRDAVVAELPAGAEAPRAGSSSA